MKTIPYLQLENLKHDLKIEKLLPPEIAYQYHALPIAFDGKRITLAISSLEDTKDSSFLSSKIGMPVNFVQADLYAINHRLEEIWQKPPKIQHRLLLWHSSGVESTKSIHYGEKVADLLGASVQKLAVNQPLSEAYCTLQHTIDNFQPDLILIDDILAKKFRRKYPLFITSRKIMAIPTSILCPISTRWPLQNLLLILSNSDTSCNASVEWACDFAQAIQAAVTILIVLPPIPLFYGHTLQHNVPALLRSKDPFGEKARWIVERCAEKEVKGIFKLRQGEPDYQIITEISASAPDLIFIDGESPRFTKSLIKENILPKLLRMANCPTLIAK